ncbi:MAG TPA: DUF47 family protein [Actinomycetota bacterium]|nr:DUF47 family protein [Actinomycetota bacterium]
MKRTWFLPETPDVLGMLCEQAVVTSEGLRALAEWGAGDERGAEIVRAHEHLADEHKRKLRKALTEAFTTPLDAEDLYVMSERLDAVMNGAKDAVREAEVMALQPDEAVAKMASLLAEGVEHLGEAFRCLRDGKHDDRSAATDAADAAVSTQRRLEKVYRNAMSALIGVDDLREVMARRELYRRFSRISEIMVEAADRVWYATVKER